MVSNLSRSANQATRVKQVYAPPKPIPLAGGTRRGLWRAAFSLLLCWCCSLYGQEVRRRSVVTPEAEHVEINV